MRTTRVKPRSELKNTAYEIFIGVLSILSIVNLVLVYALHGDGALQQILSVMNALFSVIFLGDFVYRMATAPSAGRYFLRGYGWADLLASLPFPQLKILRIFRLLRVYRLMRDLGPRTIWNTLVHDRANSTLMTLLLLGVLVFQFGSISILAVEGHAAGANITSASDALWYTIVTISTVGYGDQFPVTNTGRILGALIIVVGVGIFGTFTGYLANLFLGPGSATPEDTAAAEAPAAPGAPTAPGTPAATPASTPATPPTVDSGATESGVAAGAVAGAVAAGSTAAQGETGSTAIGERLAELLAQSERTTAELRLLVADAGPGAAGD